MRALDIASDVAKALTLRVCRAASVQEQLRVSHASTPNYPLPHPPPPFPPPSASPATPLSPAIAALPPNLNLPDKVQGSVLPNPSQFEEDTLRNFLAGERATRQEIGPGMLDWRLMQPSLAEALTQSLLDGELSTTHGLSLL